MSAKVQYVIQHRANLKDNPGFKDSWHDVPTPPHADIYKAIAELDGFRNGVATDLADMPKDASDFIKGARRIIDALNCSVELRIVKQTITEEVVEEAIAAW